MYLDCKPFSAYLGLLLPAGISCIAINYQTDWFEQRFTPYRQFSNVTATRILEVNWKDRMFQKFLRTVWNCFWNNKRIYSSGAYKRPRTLNIILTDRLIRVLHRIGNIPSTFLFCYHVHVHSLYTVCADRKAVSIFFAIIHAIIWNQNRGNYLQIKKSEKNPQNILLLYSFCSKNWVNFGVENLTVIIDSFFPI